MGRRRTSNAVPLMERLEDRTLLSTITWNTTAAPNGGDWDTGTNWNGNVIPGPNDIAVISLSSSGTVSHTRALGDAVKSLSMTNVSLNLTGGSIALGNGNSTLGPITVGAGAALNVSAGANVTIGPATSSGATVTDNGTVSFAAGDTVSFNDNGYYYGSQVVVGSGGLLKASGTAFNATNGNGNNYTQIVVNSGGHFQASGSTFALGQVYLADGVVLNAGALVGNAFNCALDIPAIDIQYLSGTANSNLQFQSIDILPDTLTSGQSVALKAIGTQTTTNLRYVFPGNFTVNQGATLAVGPDVPVTIGPVTLTDNGTVSFAAGDTVSFNDNGYYYGSQVVVGSGGLLQASGTAFNATNGSGTNGNNYAQIVVTSGGQLNACNSSFALSNLILNAGSNAQLAVNSIANEFSINSGATINITGNNFSNISNTSNQNIVASGDPKATINLGNNYWGTTNTTQIEAKITDHTVNSNLPTVSFTPPLSTARPGGAASVTATANTSTTFNPSSQTISLSATVTSGSTKINEGSLTFTILSGINIIGRPVTVSVASGVASTSSYALPAGTAAGTYTIQAIYYGTGNYLGYIDAGHSLTINAAATTTTAKSTSITYSTVAQSVPLTAAVTSAAGTVSGGTVTFSILNGGTTIATSSPANVVNGNTVGASVTLPAGTAINNYTIQAVYSGMGNFGSSTDRSQVLKVNSTATTTSVISSATSSVVGQAVTFTAIVTASSPGLGTPVGTVTFKDGPTTLATENLTGGATTFTTSGLALGTHSITAVYGGNTNFATSTSVALTQKVNKDGTSTVVVSSANPSVFGQTVTFTAVVIAASPGVGTPTGTVTFKDGPTALGSPVALSGGTATFSTSQLAVGTHSITVVYSGDANFTTSTSAALSQTANKDGTSTAVVSSANPSVFGHTVTFTAVVTAASPGVGTPTGTVTFKDGTTALGSPVALSGGTATFSTSQLAVGTHSITVVYSGDANFITSTSAVLSQVVQASSGAAFVGPTGNSVDLGATVTSPVGAISRGTETSKDLRGTSVIGAPAASKTASQQVTHTAILETAGVGANLRPGRHNANVHRPKINRGPLALTRAAHKGQPRSDYQIRVADKHF